MLVNDYFQNEHLCTKNTDSLNYDPHYSTKKIKLSEELSNDELIFSNSDSGINIDTKLPKFDKIKFDIFYYDETKFTECVVNLYYKNILVHVSDYDSNDDESIFSTWIVIEDIEEISSQKMKNNILMAIQNILKYADWDMNLRTNWEIILHSVESTTASQHDNICEIIKFNQITANDLI